MPSRRTQSAFPPGEVRLPDGTAASVAGEGRPVVLLHGVGLERSMWQAVVHELAGSLRVIGTYDLLGHGESPPAGVSAALGDFAAQLERLIGFLGIEPAAIVGFSFGGLIARAFALAQPAKVERLVVMASVYDRSPAEQTAVEARLAKARADGPSSIVGAAIERWFSPAFIAGQPEIIGRIERRLQANDPASFLAAYALFAAANRGFAGRLSRIACPTLVTTGELDTGSTPDMACRMAAAIPGAICEIVPEGRHMMPVERADEVSHLLRRFLDS